VPEAAAILARLDRIMAELAELRAEVVAQMPAVVDAAGRVPVVAAGGLADGRGLAAALAIGACGVCVARFLPAISTTISRLDRASEQGLVLPFRQLR
jgi:isopentenyl diphosphate isomerase/L-lactate dehydrogenase-like FMN-dependent dehydrogenase